MLTYVEKANYAHNADYFTQGLIYAEGLFVQSNGLYNNSSIIFYNIGETENLLEYPLNNSYFGEGLCLIGDNKVFQLTWRENTALSYECDLVNKTLSYLPNESDILSTFNSNMDRNQGWGIAAHPSGRYMVTSDGSNKLYFFECEPPYTKLNELLLDGLLPNQNSINNINELEFIGDYLLGNIWLTPYIFVYHPISGLKWLDLGEIIPPSSNGNVLNGIAYDSHNDKLFVTGKLWDKIYEIETMDALSSSRYPPIPTSDYLSIGAFLDRFQQNLLTIGDVISCLKGGEIYTTCQYLGITSDKLVDVILDA